MTIRRVLFGLLGAAVLCGAANAGPPATPSGPQSEGRELDPVARDFYLGETPAAATAAAPARATARATHWSPFTAVVAGVYEAATMESTIPLGTVSPGSETRE